jgi:hypothetical protein
MKSSKHQVFLSYYQTILTLLHYCVDLKVSFLYNFIKFR